jgi:cell division protein FtsN
MPRDYKHTKRRAGAGAGLSGLAGFVAGLALGLTAALIVYLYDRRPESRVAQQAAPMTREKAPAPNEPASGSEREETQFDFYEMLPKFEVVIPEQDGGAPAGPGAGPVEKPGAYILQAGSFRNHADADRVRALIAMQGVESKIQKVTIDKDTWHRVRVGPITNLQKLEETRSKLRQARIDALVIRVGE